MGGNDLLSRRARLGAAASDAAPDLNVQQPIVPRKMKRFNIPKDMSFKKIERTSKKSVVFSYPF